MIKAVIFDVYETLVTQHNSPLYFGEQIAEDIGIPNEEFQKIWKPSGEKRTLGLLTLEEVLETILREHNCYSEDLLKHIVEKRIAAKEECFQNLHQDILPLLTEIWQTNKKTGLISNCFPEEAMVIRQSALSEYFNSICLSCELGMKKPDPEIYKKCLAELYVRPDECLYVGDGGSEELHAAHRLGMVALQAGWYLERDGCLEKERQEEFPLLSTPKDVLWHLLGAD